MTLYLIINYEHRQKVKDEPIYFIVYFIYIMTRILDEAKKTINEITGLEVNDITASVDPSTGTIKEYKVGVKIAFGVED
jgi:hypothetical protein